MQGLQRTVAVIRGGGRTNRSPNVSASTASENSMMINEKQNWDDEADVVVVGFGGAGACAALAAAEAGADVLVLERFNGGGATRMSGGVAYIGGGTDAQKRAGFDDTPENMAAYLALEAKDVVKPDTLAEFCRQSPNTLHWLEKHGVRFGSECYPYKTSYPPDPYCLYFSGNESFPPFKDAARPTPRGHRAMGTGMPGANFYQPLRDSVLKHGIRVRCQSRLTRLITDSSGAVIGVEASSIPPGSLAQRLHAFLSEAAHRLRYPTFAWPALIHIVRFFAAIFESRARPFRVMARKGVILSTGGFVRNRAMLAQYAPLFCRGKALGAIAEDGSGILLAQDVGGAVGAMGSVSAWRFINPPLSFVRGILVDRQGKRICNEQYYGAQVGDRMVREHGGYGYLIIDEAIWRQSFKEIGRGKVQWFQNLTSYTNLLLNNRKGKTLRQLAARCGIDPDGLAATVESYNAMARGGGPDPTGKASDMLQPLEPPFRAVNCSLDSAFFACAVITMGGLVVDEATGQVKRSDGSAIPGLYAAGRTAVGLTSTNYVSGLAIADAVFSGRRAGRSAAGVGG